MTTSPRRVLVTGAGGTVAGDSLPILLDRTRDDWELVLTDVDADPDADPPVQQLDVRDLEACEQAFAGVDTVVHLAGAAAPDSPWETVLDLNIVGTRTVLEAARIAGVRRVVLASSNHAMGMYDRDERWPVYNSQPPRPDSLYGVSKVFGEVLGRFYHEEHGLDVIALRIGWVSGDYGAADQDIVQAMWLSPGDAAQVVQRAVEAPTRFGVYYAVSDNPNRRWDLTDAMLELGYRPQDSWHEVADEEERVVPGGERTPDSWPEA